MPMVRTPPCMPAERATCPIPCGPQDWPYRPRRAQGCGCHLPHPGRHGCACCRCALLPACLQRALLPLRCCRRRRHCRLRGMPLLLQLAFPFTFPLTPHLIQCRGVLRPQKVPGGVQGCGAPPAGQPRGRQDQARHHRQRAAAGTVRQEVRGCCASFVVLCFLELQTCGPVVAVVSMLFPLCASLLRVRSLAATLSCSASLLLLLSLLPLCSLASEVVAATCKWLAAVEGLSRSAASSGSSLPKCRRGSREGTPPAPGSQLLLHSFMATITDGTSKQSQFKAGDGGCAHAAVAPRSQHGAAWRRRAEP